MTSEFVIVWMIFMHVFDDYFLQSAFLSKGKQRDWWRENAPDKKYEKDYIMCLLMHGASWAFCIMLPIACYLHFNVNILFISWFTGNFVLHSVVDDLKANQKVINLVQDQIIHMGQIFLTWFIFITLAKDGLI